MHKAQHIVCLTLLLGFSCPAPAQAWPSSRGDRRAGVHQQKKIFNRSATKGVKRRWVINKVQRVRHKLHLEGRFIRAKKRFKATPLGKRTARVTKKIRRLSRAARGQLTHTADKMESRLPPGSRRARAFARVRSLSPLSLGAFSYRKFKQDPVFLGAYKGFSWTFGRVAPAVMLKMGAGVSASLLIPGIVGSAMDFGLIFGREHQLRKRQNPDQTLRQTARGLVGDYRSFVDKRRVQNRRYHKVYSRAIFGGSMR